MSPENESLFEFPCDFPIKIMGKSHPEFAETIVTVMRQFDSEVDASRVETRPSSGGNYTGLTVTVRAHEPRASRRYLSRAHRPSDGQSGALRSASSLAFVSTA